MDEEGGQRIDISHLCRLIEVSEAEILRVARMVMHDHGGAADGVSIAIVDDATITELHKTYLNKPGATDVLSFDLSDDQAESMEGQVVVSAETAHRQASRRGVTPEAELMLYIVHGMLHLMGFDDLTPDAFKLMHREEDRLLDALGYGRPYEQGGASGTEGRPAEHADRLL